MAGRPKRRAMIEELERLTRSYFDVETEENPHSHLDYAIAQIESGVPIAGIAKLLSDSTKLDIQRSVLSKYLHDSDPQATERIASARPIMAHAMAEDALGIVDAPMADKLEVQHAGLRARMREALAKMYNPEFQPNKQPSVQVNIGSLHLDALRSPMRMQIGSEDILRLPGVMVPDNDGVYHAPNKARHPAFDATHAHTRTIEHEG